MKILIIGGTGNISTAITRYLMKQGKNDLFLYNWDNVDVEGTTTIFGDRTNYVDFEEKVAKLGKFDVVIDMICYEPDDARCDVRCFGGKTKQFIFCSTVDTFTKPGSRYPIVEDDEKKPSITFPYAYKKGLCENIFNDASQRGDFQLTIIRPVATYNDTSYPLALIGSGDHLLKRIKEGKPIIVLGDGTSFWVSCHRDDTARAFAGAAGNEKSYGKTYNAAGEEYITWEAYFKTVANVMGVKNIDFVHIPTDLLVKIAPTSAEWCGINFKYNNIFDNTSAKRDLGFKYTVTWEEGVKKMVDYHETRGDIEKAKDNVFYDLIVEKFRNMEDELVYELSKFDK